MSNSLFSKAMQEKLQTLKSELKPKLPNSKVNTDQKPNAPSVLPSKKHIEKLHKTMQAELGAQAPEADSLLFEQAMVGVRPLASKNTVQPHKLKKDIKTTKKDAQTLAKRAAAEGNPEDTKVNTPLSDMQALMNPVASEAYLMYKDASLQNRIFTQLKQGKLRWFEAVDIHGSTVEQARDAVQKVIRLTQENGYTVCKIVHGKGKDAVLKTCVNGWLRQHPEVLAFVSATPKDGGSGAVVVLLKRSQGADSR